MKVSGKVVVVGVCQTIYKPRPRRDAIIHNIPISFLFPPAPLFTGAAGYKL